MNGDFLLDSAIREIGISEVGLRALLADYVDHLESAEPDAAMAFVDRMESDQGFMQALLAECRASMVVTLLVLTFDKADRFSDVLASVPKASHDPMLQGMRRVLVDVAVSMNKVPAQVSGIDKKTVKERIAMFLSW